MCVRVGGGGSDWCGEYMYLEVYVLTQGLKEAVDIFEGSFLVPFAVRCGVQIDVGSIMSTVQLHIK